MMKSPKFYVPALIVVAFLFVYLVLTGEASAARATARAAQHQTAVAQADTAIATNLANEGINGFGTPTANQVPFVVEPGCIVDMFLKPNGTGGDTLYLPISTASGQSKPVDTVTDAASAAIVRQNVVSLGLCK